MTFDWASFFIGVAATYIGSGIVAVIVVKLLGDAGEIYHE